MNIVKKLFVQSMIISTSILFLNGINMVIQHFAGNDLTLQWFHPVSIILTAVLCSLPTILLRDSDQWDRGKLDQCHHNLFHHLCLCLAVVPLAGQTG